MPRYTAAQIQAAVLAARAAELTATELAALQETLVMQSADLDGQTRLLLEMTAMSTDTQARMNETTERLADLDSARLSRAQADLNAIPEDEWQRLLPDDPEDDDGA